MLGACARVLNWEFRCKYLHIVLVRRLGLEEGTDAALTLLSLKDWNKCGS